MKPRKMKSSMNPALDAEHARSARSHSTVLSHIEDSVLSLKKTVFLAIGLFLVLLVCIFGLGVAAVEYTKVRPPNPCTFVAVSTPDKDADL